MMGRETERGEEVKKRRRNRGNQQCLRESDRDGMIVKVK